MRLLRLSLGISHVRGFLLLAASVRLLVSAWAAAPSAPWPHELSDVRPDPAITWGRLENGLRYVIRKNTEPRGRVSLVLQVAAGSAHERDDQLGYAHFLEHMMFRGTRRFPANSLVGKLQREGLAMGADSSAFTNYVSTFYNLDLPLNTPDKIALGLSILRDFADGATLAKKDLKLEARVVESERRTRDSSAAQIGDALNEFLQPGTRFAARSPIGTIPSIQQATPEKLREFHQQWYRPSRLTVIAVGDAEPAEVERLIREHFASLRAATPNEPADPDLSFPTPARDVQTRYFASPVEGGTSTMLYSVSPFQAQPDSLAQRQHYLVLNAAFWMLHARLHELTRKTPADFGESQVSWTSSSLGGQLAFVRVDSRRDLWRRALRIAEQELRRALEHGFTADELAIQQQAYRNWFRESIRNAPNRESAGLAEQIRSSLEAGMVVTSPEEEWAQSESTLEQLTTAQCLAAFRELWQTENRRIAIVGNYAPPLSADELRVAYDESRAVTFFSAHDERKLRDFEYTDFGPAGKIAKQTHDARIDTHSVEFANGVRANLKQTDFEKNRVHVRIRFGDGLAQEPADKIGLGLITGGAFVGGGLGRYDQVELGRVLAGDSLSVQFTVEEDAFYFTGEASPDKLEKLFQLVTAFFTDPAFRAEGFTSAYGQLQSQYSHVLAEPSEFLAAAAPNVMASGDPRYGLPNFDRVAERTPEEMQAWLKPILARAPIEIGIAGSVEIEPALAALSRTLGTLPTRDFGSVADLKRRPILPPRGVRENWPLHTPEAKAAVRVYWPGVGIEDYHDSRKLQVLAAILNDRLRVKIREELGATYGPAADEWGSERWPGYGYLCVAIETSPQLAEKVATLTRKIAGDIAAHGVTKEEFTRAIEPVLAGLDQQMRDNTYWTYHVLAKMQEIPGRVQWPLTRKADYQGMTVESVNTLARRHLSPDRASVFIARPAR